MNRRIECLTLAALGVMLDALSYYLETKEQRKGNLLRFKEKYEQRLEYYVIMAQLEPSMIDTRDETDLSLKLIEKKIINFEKHTQDAEILYRELLKYLESENRKVY